MLPILHILAAALLSTASVSADNSAAQELKLSLESYPRRRSVKDLARPYAEARSHPEDPNAVGSLGRILHAWEQWGICA